MIARLVFVAGILVALVGCGKSGASDGGVSGMRFITGETGTIPGGGTTGGSTDGGTIGPTATPTPLPPTIAPTKAPTSASTPIPPSPTSIPTVAPTTAPTIPPTPIPTIAVTVVAPTTAPTTATSGSGADGGVIGSPTPVGGGDTGTVTGSTGGTTTGSTSGSGSGSNGGSTSGSTDGSSSGSGTTTGSTTGSTSGGTTTGSTSATPTPSPGGADGGTIGSGTSGTGSDTGSTSGTGSTGGTSSGGTTPGSTDGTTGGTSTGGSSGGTTTGSTGGTGTSAGGDSGGTTSGGTEGGSTGGTSGGSDGGSTTGSTGGTTGGTDGGTGTGSTGGSTGSTGGSGTDAQNCAQNPTAVGQGILVLDPREAHAFNMTGNGQLWVNATVKVNSESPTAGFLVGNSTVTAPVLDFKGELTTNGPVVLHVPVISEHQPRALDPLRYLAAPNPSALVQRSSSGVQLSKGHTVLQPGVYKGGISLSGKATAEMRPGIYYLDGGGFSVSGQASVSGSDLLLYNAPRLASDRIQFSGNGIISLKAARSGTYLGILVFQRRDADVRMDIVGNADSYYEGMFYAASSEVKVSGNGVCFVGSQYISRLLEVRGNGDLRILWNPQTAPVGCPP